jgi:hypothetical protein
MSWLSSGLRKVNKTLKPLRGVGKVIGSGLDVVSDFLPPGLSAVGNVGAKLMQNKNLKSSLIGAGKDMVMGKIGGMVAGKLAGSGSKAASEATKRMGSIDDFAARTVGHGATDNIDNVLKAGTSHLGLGGKIGNIAKDAAGKISGGAITSAISNRFAGGNAGSPTDDVSYDPNASGERISTATRSGSGGGWQDFLKNPGLLEAGAGLAGSVISGAAQGAMADKDRAWEKDKFGVEQAPGLQRDIESAPIRDKAMYLLTQRMGMQPESFTPHDIFNPSYGSGPAKLGGYDDALLSQQNAAYTPGAGGVTTDLQKELLKKLGYGQKPVTAGR